MVTGVHQFHCYDDIPRLLVLIMASTALIKIGRGADQGVALPTTYIQQQNHHPALKTRLSSYRHERIYNVVYKPAGQPPRPCTRMVRGVRAFLVVNVRVIVLQAQLSIFTCSHVNMP